MIGYNRLGINGRFGNQLFQYAALRGIAAKHGYEFCIPPDNARTANYGMHHPFKLKHLKNIGQVPYATRNEAHFHFDQDLFNTCPDEINLDGYLQSEQYFKHIEKQIREAFTFVDEIREPTEEAFKSNFGNTEVVAIHLRRGDYLKYPHHPVQALEYYTKALSHIPENIPVMIFSDGIEWCKEQEIFQGDRFIFAEGNNTGVDLCLQSLCTYHIIANSSFSWWGAWLAKSKKTVAPSIWFAGPDASKDLSDLYCPEWIII